jgi:hypothetical protein
MDTDDYDGCCCSDPDCPECNPCCHYCDGDGWGIDGDTWPLDDPVNDAPGAIVRCPCCGGSGLARDCTFW